MSKLYSCEEIAERYSVQVITVWDWIRKKKLPALKIGREYRVSDEDINAFENKCRTVQKEPTAV
jgi:excisionase family DNA binding protein